ncbi:MAG TPA: hypothetical protein VHO06_25565 [Polyangia bacterium]|nr:hypothetical protein [Polyangia bacterium]
MAAVDTLAAKLVPAFEEILKLLCDDAFQVNPSITDAGNFLSIVLVATVSPADEAAIQAQGGDAALLSLAAAMGARSGVAAVAFQFE